VTAEQEHESRYLGFIAESIARIEDYLPAGLTVFLAEPMRQDAIVWRLQAIADAAKNHLTQELKDRHPEIPWRAVYGFRNVAAHQYAGINLELVWELAATQLGPLKDAVESELRRAR
jgi:uncharacterized protein with HEPN domain